MINRRAFFHRTLGALALTQAACSTDPKCPVFSLTCPTPPTKTAQVNMLQLAQAIEPQHCEQWCWAASISMIFAHHGHPVLQETIVLETFGSLICAPAGAIGSPSTTVGRAFSRPWRDTRGVIFNSQVVAAYDQWNGISNLTNQMIVDGLNANSPLLYCNQTHAMVLYSVSYFDTTQGPNIVAAQVIDPWPPSQRSHPLSQAELGASARGGQMSFLAQVRIS